LISDDGSDLERRLYVIDGATGNLEQNLEAPAFLRTVTFDQPDFQLIAEDGRGLLGSIYRYGIDLSTALLTLMQARGVGSNCGELAISPTGGHLAFPCAATDDYSGVFDFDPADLATIDGEWIPRSYAKNGVAFAPDGLSIAIADATNLLQIFSVQTH